MDSPQMIPDDCLISAFGLLEREEALLFLVQRIVHLPQVPRRVLAMYYHESLSLSEIALYFGLTEGQIDKIRIETVDLLRKYLLSLWAKALRSRELPPSKAISVKRFSPLGWGHLRLATTHLPRSLDHDHLTDQPEASLEQGHRRPR